MLRVFLHYSIAEAVILVLGGFGQKLQGIDNFFAAAAFSVAIITIIPVVVFICPVTVPVAAASIALGLRFLLLPRRKA